MSISQDKIESKKKLFKESQVEPVNTVKEEIKTEVIAKGLSQAHKITTFNPVMDDIEHPSITITSKRRTGKSFLTRRLIYENRHNIDEIFIFSNTINVVPKSDWAFIPRSNQYEDIDEEIIEKILAKQRDIKEYNETEHKKIRNNVVVILDDVICDAVMRKRNNKVNKLYVQGRHSDVSVYTLLQSFSGNDGVSPLMKKNSDFLISFYQQDFNARKQMSEQFLSVGDVKTGMSTFQDLTSEDHVACVINNSKNCKKLEEYVYTYKAPKNEPPEFMIGRKDKDLTEIKTVPRTVIEKSKPKKPKQTFITSFDEDENKSETFNPFS